MIRISILAVLAVVLPDWTQPSESVYRLAENHEVADGAIDAAADHDAGKNLAIARAYLARRQYPAALSRLKTVVTQYQTSPYAEEALALLVETSLAVGAAPFAQAAVEVLLRKFPDGDWSVKAQDALKAAGFEPVSDKNSWISRAFP